MDWDKFTFDFKLDLYDLLSDLVAVEAHKQSAQNLVLPPDWRAQLDRLNRVRAVHGTTALEGNPLSEAEVSQQMDIADQPKEVPKPQATKEQQQIRNAGIAQSWVRGKFAPGSRPIDLSDILSMHRMITEGSDETHNVPGQLRRLML